MNGFGSIGGVVGGSGSESRESRLAMDEAGGVLYLGRTTLAELMRKVEEPREEDDLVVDEPEDDALVERRASWPMYGGITYAGRFFSCDEMEVASEEPWMECKLFGDGDGR